LQDAERYSITPPSFGMTVSCTAQVQPSGSVGSGPPLITSSLAASAWHMPSVASFAPPSAHAFSAFASASGGVAEGAAGVQPIIVKL